jgi:hypothetical protein
MNRVVRFAALILFSIGLACLGTNQTAAAQMGYPPERVAILHGSSPNYQLDWVAVGEIGAGKGSSANYQLSGTSGQMGAGTSSESSHYALCVGFQCASGNGESHVYLPLVER